MSNKNKDSWASKLLNAPKSRPVATNNSDSDGSTIKFSNTYTLWSHDINSKNWKISGYKKICNFNDVSSFWRIINNFHKLNVKFFHFFIMKEGIQPIWEHPPNRMGGVCSFKLELNNFSPVWEDFSMRFVCGILSNDHDDINGISISPKNNWAIIKVWNKNSDNDLSLTLSRDLLNKYAKLGVRYKKHIPEY